MTTIAVKDGIIAADSRITAGNCIYNGEQSKLSILSDGSIVAFAGRIDEGTRAIAWLSAKKRKRQKLLDGINWSQITVIQLMPDGTVLERINDPMPLVLPGSYWAWGSGQDFAIGALATGCSAEQAVRAACKHDTGSAEPIHVMEIKRKKKVLKK